VVPNDEDDYSDSIPLPFDFKFFNKTHLAGESIFACSNGQLNFRFQCSYDEIFQSADSHIVAFGTDLGTVNKGISYGISGISPNRVLVVDYNTNLLGYPWNVFNHYQIQLFESKHSKQSGNKYKTKWKQI